MKLLRDVGQVEAPLGLFGESVNLSVRDQCMVCTECTMGMGVILGVPDGTPR
jgi:hypothetical protein